MAAALPPPPDRPELPPEVTLAGEEPLRLRAADGVELEARGRFPASPERAVLLLHPHPLYGGTMHNAIVVIVGKALAERGGDRVATLRLNYRGVGTSTGSYGAGEGETLDARAGLAELRRRYPHARLSIVAYSFGTWVGLRAAALDGGVERVTLVAPAVRLFEFGAADEPRFAGPIAIVCGEADAFCSVAEAERLAAQLGARLDVVAQADHFFVRHRRRVADLVVPTAAPELA